MAKLCKPFNYGIMQCTTALQFNDGLCTVQYTICVTLVLSYINQLGEVL